MGNTQSTLALDPESGENDDDLLSLSDGLTDGERTASQAGPRPDTRIPLHWYGHPYFDFSLLPGSHTMRSKYSSNRYAGLEVDEVDELQEAVEELREMIEEDEEEQDEEAKVPTETEQNTLDGFFADILAISASRTPQRGSIPSFEPPTASTSPTPPDSDNLNSTPQVSPSSSQRILSGAQTPDDFLKSFGNVSDVDDESDDDDEAQAVPTFSEALAAVVAMMEEHGSFESIPQFDGSMQGDEYDGDDSVSGSQLDSDSEEEEEEGEPQDAPKDSKGKAVADCNGDNSNADTDVPTCIDNGSNPSAAQASAPAPKSSASVSMSWRAYTALAAFLKAAGDLSDSAEFAHFIAFRDAEREARLDEHIPAAYASLGLAKPETEVFDSNEAGPASAGPATAGLATVGAQNGTLLCSVPSISGPSTLQPRGSPSKVKVKNVSPQKTSTTLCPVPVAASTATQSVTVQNAPAPAPVLPDLVPVTVQRVPAPQLAQPAATIQNGLPTPPPGSSPWSSSLGLTPAQQDELDELEAGLSRYPVSLVTRQSQAQEAKRIADLQAQLDAANDRALLAELRLQALKKGHAEPWVMRMFRRRRHEKKNGGSSGPGGGSSGPGGGPGGGGGGGPGSSPRGGPGGGSGPSGGSGGHSKPKKDKDEDNLNPNGNGGGNDGNAPNGGGGGAGARTRPAQRYPRSRAQLSAYDANDLPAVGPRSGRPESIARPVALSTVPAPTPPASAAPVTAPAHPIPAPAPARIRFPPGISAAYIQAAREANGLPSPGPQLEITRSLAPHLPQIIYTPDLSDGFDLPDENDDEGEECLEIFRHNPVVRPQVWPQPQPQGQAQRQQEFTRHTPELQLWRGLENQWQNGQWRGVYLPPTFVQPESQSEPQGPSYQLAEQSSYTPVQGFRRLQSHPVRHLPASPGPAYVPPPLRALREQPQVQQQYGPPPPPTPQWPSAYQRGWYLHRAEVPPLILPESVCGIELRVPPPLDVFEHDFDMFFPSEPAKLNPGARPFTPRIPRVHSQEAQQQSEQQCKKEQDEEEQRGVELYPGLRPGYTVPPREANGIIAPHARRAPVDIRSHVRRWSDALEREAAERDSGALTQFPTFRSNRHFVSEPSEPAEELPKPKHKHKKWRRPDSPAPFATFFPDDSAEHDHDHHATWEEATVCARRHPSGPRAQPQPHRQQQLPPRLAALAEAENRLNQPVESVMNTRTVKANRPRSPARNLPPPRATYTLSFDGELVPTTSPPPQQRSAGNDENDETQDQDQDTVHSCSRRHRRKCGPRS